MNNRNIVIPESSDRHAPRGYVFFPKKVNDGVFWDVFREGNLDGAYVRVDLGIRYYVRVPIFMTASSLVHACKPLKLTVLTPAAYHRLRKRILKQFPSLSD